MAGLCGALSPAGHEVEGMAAAIQWTDQEHRFDYDDDVIRVAATAHDSGNGEQPAVSPAGGEFVWTTGSLYGVEALSGYEPRDVTSVPNYCATLHGRYGLDFPARANGTYASVVYDPRRSVVSFVTDRLGTHPLYYARPEDGGFVFSTHVQSLVQHPDVETAFDPAYLAEYCSLGRVAGVETPLRGVRQLPPATVAHLDVDTGELRTERYWEPVYEPLDRPFDYFVDRFSDLVSTILAERIDEDDQVGLLLSGGSDSRLLLHGAPEATTCFHLADWMSDEARTAERVALTADADFRWLQRGEDYHESTLERAGQVMNYAGRFEQAHVAGYLDDLQSEVDVLVSGLYADTLFQGCSLPRWRLSLGALGRLTLPVERRVDSVDDYLDLLPREAPPYLDTDRTLRETLRANLDVDSEGRVVDHGVAYPSFRERMLFGDCFPLTNDSDLFYWALEQTMPHWTPFLDNRLVDLALKMPLSYHLRRNVSNAATSRLVPELAEIPNASTGVSLDRSFPLQYLGRNLTALKRKFFSGDTPPQPYFSHHPWTYYQELLRHRRFPLDQFYDYRELIERTDVLDWDGVLSCYERHVAGEFHGLELYTLLSLLAMPATQTVADGDEGGGLEWTIGVAEGERSDDDPNDGSQMEVNR